MTKPRHQKPLTDDQYFQIDEQARKILEHHLLCEAGEKHDLDEIEFRLCKSTITIDPGRTIIDLVASIHSFYWSLGRERYFDAIFHESDPSTSVLQKYRSVHYRSKLLKPVNKKRCRVNNLGSKRKGPSIGDFHRTLITFVAQESRQVSKVFRCKHRADWHEIEKDTEKDDREYYYLVNDRLREAVDKTKGKLTKKQAIDLIKKFGILDCIAEVMQYASQSKADRETAAKFFNQLDTGRSFGYVPIAIERDAIKI